jgi:hypothetical protein
MKAKTGLNQQKAGHFFAISGVEGELYFGTFSNRQNKAN